MQWCRNTEGLPTATDMVVYQGGSPEAPHIVLRKDRSERGVVHGRPPPSRPRAADDRGPTDGSTRLRRHPGFADRSHGGRSERLLEPAASCRTTGDVAAPLDLDAVLERTARLESEAVTVEAQSWHDYQGVSIVVIAPCAMASGSVRVGS